MPAKFQCAIPNGKKVIGERITYCKFPKYFDTQKICCNHSKIWTMWLYHRVMSPNNADGMANSVDPDQRSSLIWVCTVYPDLSVRKLRNITVHLCHRETVCWRSWRQEKLCCFTTQFCISSICVKREFVNRVWFCTVNSNGTVGQLPAYLGKDLPEMLVLVHDIFILTSQHNLLIWCQTEFQQYLKHMTDRRLTSILMFVGK